MNIVIRQEDERDMDPVFEVNRAAFGQDNEARLVNLLRQNEAFVPELSLVACVEHKIVGHILFSKIQIVNAEHGTSESLALAPMAVLPEFQHKGIGSQLVRFGLAKARALNYKSVIVLGHPNYYPKFGFSLASKWNIQSPYDVPDNVFMALELVPDGLNNTNGLVRYSPAFESL